MDTNPDQKNPQEINTNPLSTNPPLKKPIKKPKPIIEGINSPKSTSDIVFVKPTLTKQEHKLVSESEELPEPELEKEPEAPIVRKLDMPSQKSHHFMGMLITTIIILAIVVGGYKFYTDKLKQSSVVDINHLPTHTTDSQNTPSPTTILDSSSTPATASTTINTTASTTPPAVKTPQLKINATPTGFLNVRATPSTGASVVYKVHPGEYYSYSQTQNGWYLIAIPNNKTGWVSGQYVTLQ